MRNSQVFLEIPASQDRTDVTYIELTVTSQLDINMNTQISSHPTLSAEVVSDNAVNDNKSYSITGLISDTPNSVLDFQRDVARTYSLLQSVRDNRTLFSLHFDSANLQPPVSNCLLTALNFSKTEGMGRSYKVQMSVKEVLLSREQLVSQEQFASAEIEDQHSDTPVKKVVATTEKDSQSLLIKLEGFFSNLFSFSSVEEDINNGS